jgi:hypothetical protein
LSRWSADLNSDDRDLVRAHSHISIDATVRTVRHPVRKSQPGATDDAQVRTVRHRVRESQASGFPNHWSAPAARRGETVQDRHRGGVKANVRGAHVLVQMLEARGAGDQEDVRVVGQQPG